MQTLGSFFTTGCACFETKLVSFFCSSKNSSRDTLSVGMLMGLLLFNFIVLNFCDRSSRLIDFIGISMN